MNNDIAGKIEYIIRNYESEAVEKIAEMLAAKDRFIKKLSDVSVAQEKELEWYRGVMQRYEAIMQKQADLIEEYKVEDIARGQGRDATFIELVSCHKHIPTERYES